jgi:DNA repair protein RecN (Recombination protein N)
MALARRYKRPAEEPPALADWKRELQQLDAASDLASWSRRAAHAKAYQAEPSAVAPARQGRAPAVGAITAAMQSWAWPAAV